MKGSFSKTRSNVAVYLETLLIKTAFLVFSEYHLKFVIKIKT